MWNVVFNPLESVIAPVIRGNPWGWDEAPENDDWPYVLFDWDTHFAAFMLALDAKELGYSTLIQVVKAKTARGFVPNGMAPTRKSTHSQPPVGSRVLLEMYRRYRETWLVELLFDDLLDWSNWFHANRRLAPLNLTALGGDDMQAARYESNAAHPRTPCMVLRRPPSLALSCASQYVSTCATGGLDNSPM